MPRRLNARLCHAFLVDTFVHCVPENDPDILVVT